MRQQRTARYRRAPNTRHGLGWAILVTLLLALAFIGAPLFYTWILRDLPALETIPLLLAPEEGLFWQPTRFYDRSGEHILLSVQNPAVSERRYVSLADESQALEADQIAPEMVTATLAIVDPTFWEHPGFSLEGLTEDRATSLAQRLAADLLLQAEPPGFRHALRERILATQLIATYGHAQVLEWYLNSVYYGNLAYGIDAAAQIYFGKPAAELNLAEAALLTAVAEIPTINPHDDPETALERMEVVLTALLSQGLITPSQAKTAQTQPLEFRPAVQPASALTTTFNTLVWEQLALDFDLAQLERGGYAVITALDYELQHQARCTAEIHLARLKGLPAENLTVDGTPCQAALLLPSLSLADPVPDDLATSVVILDPLSGQILALVGDLGAAEEPTYLPAHQPGSALTPFVYLTAFTRGFSPGSLVWDIAPDFLELPFDVGEPAMEYQGPVRLRSALANDYLSPALQIMLQIGPENVWRIAQQSGLTSLDPVTQPGANSVCLGCALLKAGGEVTLLQLTQAYMIFSNQGYLIGQPGTENRTNQLSSLQPVTVLDVIDANQRSLLEARAPEIRPIITPQLAYLMTHILSDEAARWPSLGHPNLLEIGRPVAAKLGQADQQSDTWAIGYTPQIMVGVWAGSPTQGEISPKIAAGLWRAIMQSSTQSLPPLEWSPPTGISQVDVCDPSGMLPTRYCPTLVNEIFLVGNEPTQPDNLYQAFAVNRETERLATVFTPPELIDERIYLIVPPLAAAWAGQADIETPPESYDVISAPAIVSTAQIQSPAMFTNVKGSVEIMGTAAGDDFQSYRLLAGQGLNPQNWLQISQDLENTVTDGLLATWDTSGLSGLYAIQLIVLHTDLRADTTTIQVTVDNQLPTVSIPYPTAGQVFQRSAQPSITFQAQANDNIGVAAVEFYLDGELLIRQTQPPYALPWTAKSGNFSLEVRVFDFASNQQTSTVEFTVR